MATAPTNSRRAPHPWRQNKNFPSSTPNAIGPTIEGAPLECLLSQLKSLRHKGINGLGGNCYGPVRRPITR